MENLRGSINPENKPYYERIIANLQELAGKEKGKPDAFYYLDAAAGIFRVLQSLSKAGFDFARGYKKERRLVDFATSVDHGNCQMKLFPVEAGSAFNTWQTSDRERTPITISMPFNGIDYVIGPDDIPEMFATAFEGIPLVFGRDFHLYHLRDEVLKDRYAKDWNPGQTKTMGPSESHQIPFVRKMTKAERKAGLEVGKVTRRKWPHESVLR